MASKRSFGVFSQDVVAQNKTTPGYRDRRQYVRAQNPIFRGNLCFFPCIQKLDDEIFHMHFPASVHPADVVCSHNIYHPLLTPHELNIPTDCNIVGIVYNPRTTTPEHVIREYTVLDFGLVRIADAQFSVTGSVGVREMEPFADIVSYVCTEKTFHQDAMRLVYSACGAKKEVFIKMLCTVAQRETFEETGFFCEPDAFDFIRFENNWAIFKMHINKSRSQSLEGCSAFVSKNPQEPQFRAGSIPFKVQVYVYGTRQELQAFISTIRVRPAVECDIAGLVLYKAGEIERWRDGEINRWIDG
jgi:hypothetical protein